MQKYRQLTDNLSQAFQRCETITVLSSDLPSSLDEAEAIQDAVISGLGPIAAWKLGATQASGLVKTGLPRFFFGALPADRVTRGGGTVAGTWHATVGVECEYAFRFDRDITPGSVVDIDIVKAAIGGVHPAFEIPATRYDGALGCHGGLANVADDGLSGWLVVGAACASGSLERFADSAVRLTVDGKVVAEGTAATRIDGFPYELLTDFVELALARGHTIAKGHFVVPGSCTGRTMVPLGAAIVGDFAELGSVEAVFRASEGK